MKVIIIEDEPLAQQELLRLLNRNSRDIDVVKLLDSVEESVKWLRSHSAYDLAFMDVQLSDGMSFDILKEVRINKPVIFTTAYDQYWMEAFKLNSIAYLLKPIEEESLERALVKLEEMKSHFSNELVHRNYEMLQGFLDKTVDKKYKTRFVAQIGERYIRIPKEKIAYFVADGNLVYLVTGENKKYLIEYTLDQVSREVDPDEFFRLNRTYLTHIGSIREVHKYFNGRLAVKLEPQTTDDIIVSRAKVKSLINWLDQ
jgi:DNA-binding LytR/AlgR family response regulator